MKNRNDDDDHVLQVGQVTITFTGPQASGKSRLKALLEDVLCAQPTAGYELGREDALYEAVLIAKRSGAYGVLAELRKLMLNKESK